MSDESKVKIAWNVFIVIYGSATFTPFDWRGWETKSSVKFVISDLKNI